MKPDIVRLKEPLQNGWQCLLVCEHFSFLPLLPYYYYFCLSSWNANPTQGNHSSFQKAQNKCVSPLRRARKQHLSHLKSEFSNLSPSSKSWWRLIKSVSVVCSSSIPSLISNGRTADTASEKAECLNSWFAANSCVQTRHFLYPHYPVAPNCP